MGIIQRIFYFHVPSTPVSFWAVAAMTVRGDRHRVGIHVGQTLLGHVWTWDARLTSSLLLVLIYFSCMAAPIEQQAPLGAAICTFGMTDVPLIYMSNRWFRTQHPSPVIGGGERSGIAPGMLLTFIAAHIAMLMLWWWCVIRVRRRRADINDGQNLSWLAAAVLMPWKSF